MRRYLIAIAALIVASCSACPGYAQTTVGVHLGSQHSSGGFNNVNPGVYLNHKGFTVGGYYNSERRASYYGGYTLELPIGPLRAGLTVGAITGYQAAKVIPLVVPSVAVVDPLLGGRWRVMFVPKVNTGGAAAVHLTHEWSL